MTLLEKSFEKSHELLVAQIIKNASYKDGRRSDKEGFFLPEPKKFLARLKFQYRDSREYICLQNFTVEMLEYMANSKTVRIWVKGVRKYYLDVTFLFEARGER
jgi:hypothetical protein